MRLLKWTGLILLCFTIAAVAGGVYLSSWNAGASEKWLAAPRPPGMMVDVGGHRLYAAVKGKGNPVVIIEAGLGSSSPEWWTIQDALAKYTTVLTYDRGGYGWSDAGTSPRTDTQIVSELNLLLKKLSLRGPFILLGHDIGGVYMMRFAETYPGDVAGMVLVDPLTHEYSRFKKELDPAVYKNLIDRAPVFRVAEFLAKTGVIRLLKVCSYGNVPEKMKSLITEQYSQKKAYKAVLDEYTCFKKSLSQMTQNRNIPARPLTIVHHSCEDNVNNLQVYGLSLDEAMGIEGIWMNMHRNLIKLSPGGRMVQAVRSTRDMHFDEPEIIIRAVADMIHRSR